ncbi:terminase small subunit [Microvirga sp. 17 mud 1-3]|uniref:terminase small subunit n=1 Tax=Microvirga sp. 17 mud 1-3 TaxID=2082949 RepID=UPI000D6D20F8|nr:terminase small subunit [Microvirga sp. 17 mud 1-3]AWM87364.1 DNA-packaging protein [Microvirga sp. 17 mud 1-3]
MAKGQTVTRSGLAEVFGVALPTVDGWVRNGVPVVTRGGRGRQWAFDTADVAAWLRDKAVAEATGDTQADEAELKRRKLQAETTKAELELAKARGDVAPVREFERAQAAAFAQIRANIMNVPQRVVVQLLGETDETQFKTKLRAELALALQESATADLVMADDEEADDE